MKAAMLCVSSYSVIDIDRYIIPLYVHSLSVCILFWDDSFEVAVNDYTCGQ